MRNKIFIGFSILFLVPGTLYILFGFPLILINNQKDIVNIKDTTQTFFNPLENIDFNTGNNVAYLYFVKSDVKELPLKINKNRLLECHSNEIIQNLQRDFIFKKSVGDMATCESKILIYKDDKLVFFSSIVLTDSIVGLQNSIMGWADAQNKGSLINSFLKFKPTTKLVIKL